MDRSDAISQAGTALRGRDVQPESVVVWGYNLYIAEVALKGGALEQSAQAVVAKFSALGTAFPVPCAEGLYMLDLQSAANALARGIQRRKEAHIKNLAVEEERKRWFIDRVRYRESAWGFLQGGWHSVAIGGFTYALVQAIFMLPALQQNAQGVERSYASLATGLGLALISAWWRGRSVSKTIDRVVTAYQDSLNHETQEYSQGVVEEVMFATETAARAWEKLTGEKATIGEAYGNLIAHVLTVGEDVNHNF